MGLIETGKSHFVFVFSSFDEAQLLWKVCHHQFLEITVVVFVVVWWWAFHTLKNQTSHLFMDFINKQIPRVSCRHGKRFHNLFVDALFFCLVDKAYM
jgi:hypothetical protein